MDSINHNTDDFLVEMLTELNDAKKTKNVIVVKKFIDEYKGKLLTGYANLLLDNLRREELERIKKNPVYYDLGYLRSLLDNSVFTKEELIEQGILSDRVLELMYGNMEFFEDFHSYRDVFDDSIVECQEGATDVYFFCVPCSGKSTLLMALLSSGNLRTNLLNSYAQFFNLYLEAGKIVPVTPRTMAMPVPVSNIKSQRFNLIDYGGIQLVEDILCNKDHIVKISEIDTALSHLLSNGNRKIFFIIIDPTAKVLRYSREVVVGHDEETGLPLIELEYPAVDQRTLIQMMVNLFEFPGNSEIMKKVDAIHIIMAKSDTLGNPAEREEKALRIFNERYADDIMEPLKDLCKRYKINKSDNYTPILYTFSLGKIYPGGLFDFNPADADALANVISNCSHSSTKYNLLTKLKNVLRC